jgi:hypothetical protein
LEETLGKENFDWNVAVVPDEEYVEFLISFDPAVLTAERVVEATKQAMERYPDPGNPGPVRVIEEETR